MNALPKRLALLCLAGVGLGSDCGGSTRSYSVNVVEDDTSGGEATFVEAIVEDQPGWSGGAQFRERVRVQLEDCAAALVSRTEEAVPTEPVEPAPALSVSVSAIESPDFRTSRCPDLPEPAAAADPFLWTSCASPAGERWLVVAPTCSVEAPTTSSATWLDATGTRVRPDLVLTEAGVGPTELQGLRCEVSPRGRAVLFGTSGVFELDPDEGARVAESAGAGIYDAAVGDQGWTWVHARTDAPGCARAEFRPWGGAVTRGVDLMCAEPPWAPSSGLVESRSGGFTVVYPLYKYDAHHSRVIDLDAEGQEECRGRFDWQRFVPAH